MSEFPPPPAGSKIQIEVSGDTLRVVIPGRWTPVFWFSLLFAMLFTAIATWMALSNAGPEPPGGRIFIQLMPFWGVLCFFWFFFMFKARTETVTLDRDFLETRGSFIPFAPKKMKSSEIQDFVLKPKGLQHFGQTPLACYGFMKRKLLFATGDRDVALAVQAEDAEFEWLRGVLEAQQRKLRPAAGISG
jgi:hypothetical protein